MTLTATGAEILLVYGAELYPARNGQPGMRVTVDGRGTCLLEAVGYSSAFARQSALDRAARTCKDAGLLVVAIPGKLIVRKRCSSSS